MNNKVLIVSLAAIVIACTLWYAWSEGLLTSLSTLDNSEQTPALPVKEGWKVYENTEFGFSFQYPQEWTVTEERDTNPYNIFQVAVTPEVLQYFQPFSVLVKKNTSRITDQFRALAGAGVRDISVGGKQATRYEYEGEVHYVTIIIPISEEYTFLIGNDRNENVEEFEQILASFRFLR